MSKELSTKTLENVTKTMTKMYCRLLNVDETELINVCRETSASIDKHIPELNRKSHKKMFSGMSTFLDGLGDTVEEDYIENIKRIS